MDEPLAVALKFGFLLVLYLFLLWVARSALRDLSRGVEAVGGTATATPVSPDAGSSRPREEPESGLLGAMEPRLEVIAALGFEPGTSFDLRDGATMGRSDHAEIRVDDPFASSAHARIFARGDFMLVEDMGSTNGTYLNGRQLRGAERLKVADVIRIGDSEYRYQE
jgi:pSer/pThr/pTyr-binding forkhead associated (FHA) protein